MQNCHKILIKRLIVFQTAFMLLASYLFAFDGNISLDDAIRISLERNNEIKSAKAKEQASHYGLLSAKGRFYPQINAEGKYTRLNEDINLDINPIRSAMIASNVATYMYGGGTASGAAALNNSLETSLPSFNMRVQDEEYFNFSVSAVQTLYAGGRIRAGAEVKKAEYLSAVRNTAYVVENITSQVVDAYFKLKLAKQVSEIRQEVYEGMKEHDVTALRLFTEGMISKANRMRASVALSEADRELKKSKREEELAGIFLANLLNVDISDFNLKTDFIKPDGQKDVNEYLQKAVVSNSALNMLAFSKQELSAAQKASYGKLLPTIAAFGKYEVYKQDLTILEPEWAAGLAVNVPLFSGLSDYNADKEVKSKQAALSDYTENVKEQIKTLVRKHHHEILAAKEQYESLGVSLDLAMENLRLNKLSFSEGVTTSLEVIDAQLALSKVKTERYKALYEYASSLAKLLNLCADLDTIKYYKEEVKGVK